MKFEEVLPALREGKKIIRKNKEWLNREKFIHLEDGCLIDNINFLYIISEEDFNANDWEIVKEPKKVKLRNLTEEQYGLWVKNNCAKYDGYCRGCPFQKVKCDNRAAMNDIWYLNKDLYSDKFLDQEIEIED